MGTLVAQCCPASRCWHLCVPALAPVGCTPLVTVIAPGDHREVRPQQPSWSRCPVACLCKKNGTPRPTRGDHGQHHQSGRPRCGAGRPRTQPVQPRSSVGRAQGDPHERHGCARNVQRSTRSVERMSSSPHRHVQSLPRFAQGDLLRPDSPEDLQRLADEARATTREATDCRYGTSRCVPPRGHPRH
jgi:hypothetical protein